MDELDFAATGRSLAHHETSVFLAETLAGWLPPSTPRGREVPEQHYRWGHRLRDDGTVLFAGPVAIADTSWFIPDLRHTGGGLGVFGGSTIGERVEVRLGVDGRSVDEGLSYCLERCGHPGVQPQKNPADAGLVRAIDTAWPQPNRLGSTSRKTGSLSSSWLKSPSSMPPRSSIANKRWARDKWATGLLLA